MTIRPPTPSSDIAFSPAVKAIQATRGSRRAYAALEERGGFRTDIDEALSAFISEQRSFFLATVNHDGQPYIQHRGGPPGFLRVLDAHTLAFADYRGNRQYISTGNLSENPKVHLFLIDYAGRARVKIWGEAEVITDDAERIASLMPQDYDARAEQALIIHVRAWDANCPQHIPQRFEASDVQAAIDKRERRIAELEQQLQQLRHKLDQP